MKLIPDAVNIKEKRMTLQFMLSFWKIMGFFLKTTFFGYLDVICYNYLSHFQASELKTCLLVALPGKYYMVMIFQQMRITANADINYPELKIIIILLLEKYDLFHKIIVF